MAVTLAELMVKVGVDAASLKTGLDKMQKSLEGTASKFKSVGKAMSVGVSMPIIAVGTAATKMAMDAVESENLFEVSMGSMADSARAWSESLRKELGLNAFEVRKNVGVFNSMFTSMGLGEKAALDMSEGLTKLSYDMASFYNLDPQEAFEKLQAGITGETEPLKRLGIVINETTVQAYALKMGLIKQGETMTEQQKIAARYGLIMEATSQAQGDLARTADSPTNRLRIMSAQLQDTATRLGMALLPALQSILTAAAPFVEKLGQMAEGFSKLSPGTQSTIIGLVALVTVLGPALVAIGQMIATISTVVGVVKAWTTAQAGLNIVLTANPIGVVIMAVAALAAAAYLIYKNWGPIKEFFMNTWSFLTTWLTNTWNNIVETAASIWNGLKEFFGKWWPELLIAFTGPLGLMALMIAKNWDTIVGTIKGAINSIISGINRFTGFLNTLRISVPEVEIPLVGKVGGFSIGLPHIPAIPMLAEGGIVNKPTLAMIGEAGREAVLPLDRGGLALGGQVNVIVELDGRVLARALGQPFVDEIRVRTGLRI